MAHMHSTNFLHKLFHRYRDEATHQKIEKHLTDINDKITDEDIRNIRIILTPQEFEQASKEAKNRFSSTASAE